MTNVDRNPSGVGSYSRSSARWEIDSGIEQQRELCRNAAAEAGLQIDPNLEFSDDAVIGAALSGKGLSDLMEAAGAGQLQLLYVQDLTRLGRDSSMLSSLLRRLVQEFDVQFVSITDGIDSRRE